MMRLWMSLALLASPCVDAAGADTPACGGLVHVSTALDEDRPEGCTSDACSLREAVALGNSCGADDTTVIVLKPGHHELHRTGFKHPRSRPPSTAAPGDSAMVVTGRIRVEGEGATIARALDAPAFRLFDVAPGAWLALSDVRITGGLAGAGAGGGVHVREGGLLFLDGAQVSGAARLGGAIYAAGKLVMQDALVQGGRAERGGGLFVAPTGSARIERSRFLQNLADGLSGFGGAIEVRGEVTARDTEFAANAARYGAAISVWHPGRLRIAGGRVAENTALEGSAALELLDSDEVAGARFERNAPRDCAFRYVQDSSVPSCSDAGRGRPFPGAAIASGVIDVRRR